MNADQELQQWCAQWQAETRVPAGLRERVKRESRRMRLVFYAELVITATVGSFATAWTMASERPAMRLLALGVWASLLMTWIFRFMNDKGNWSGAAPDTEAFLRLSLRRCRANLRAAKFGFVSYFAQMAIVSACVYWEGNRQSPMSVWIYLTLPRSLVVWCCAALFLLWMIWHIRRKKAELSYFLSVQQDWERYAEEWEMPVSGIKKWWKLTVLGSLVRAHIASWSQLEEFDWRVRRKKKIWKA